MSTPEQPEQSARTLDRCPVSVLMERRLATVGRWQQYQWECVAVVAGEGMGAEAAGCTLVSEDAGRSQFMFTGLQLRMHRDGCESYWYNLQSERPYLFVICFHDEAAADDSMAVEPVLVSASQDEANAHMEAEDLVFSVPMPQKVIDWLERYVVDNYEPVATRKRKRKDWAEEGEENAKARRTDRRFH